MLSEKFPAPTSVNTAIKRAYLAVPESVGTKINYIGIWNEPTNATQPFRQAGGFERLTKLTRELLNPSTTACKVYGCKFVSAEVEVFHSSIPQPSLTYRYASWLKTFKRNHASDARKLVYYGVHDYSEVFRSPQKGTPNASRTRLATWMRRLPTDAKVWMPEIGVVAEIKNLKGTADGTQADEPARAKQADFLFNKLSRLKTSNGAAVRRATYYNICPAPVTGFDSSVLNERDGLTAGSPDCTGTTPREEIRGPLDNGIHR